MQARTTAMKRTLSTPRELWRPAGDAALLALIGLVLAASLASAEMNDVDLDYLDSGQWTFNRDCLIQGDTLATSMEYGVQFWDVSDPAAPELIADYYTHGQPGYDLDREGDLLGITTENGRLYLLDTSDLQNLVLHQELTGLGIDPLIHFEREGATRWAYIVAGGGGGGLRIKDMSDPTAVIDRGELNLDGDDMGVAAFGDVLLVIADGVGLNVVDISDPDLPSLIHTVSVTTPMSKIHVDGERGAVAAGDFDNGFYTLDLAFPMDPQVAAQVLPDLGAGTLKISDVFVDGSLLYATAHNEGLIVYDVSDPYSPVYVGHDADNYLSSNEMDFADGKAYVSHWGVGIDGVYIADMSDPASPSYLGHTRGFDYARFAAEDGGWVHVATGDGGITYHEHVGATDLTYRGALRIDNTWGVDAAGGLVYAASESRGLVIADVRSDPENPVVLGEIDPGKGRGVEVLGDVAYCSFFDDGIVTIDVSDPATPILLDNEVVGGPETVSLNISVQLPVAATADNSGGLNLWDVGDPENIVHLANYQPGNKVKDVVIHGDVLYAAVELQGVHVLDISDPSAPVQVGPSFSSNVKGLDVDGDHLHLARGGARVETYSVENPTDPAFLSDYDTVGFAHSVTAAGNYVYVSDHSGLAALRFMDSTAAAVLFFDLAWDGNAVTLRWESDLSQGEPEFRVLATPASEPESYPVSIPVELASAGAYRAVDDRLVLGAGGAWRYSLQELESNGDWTLLREGIIETGGSAPGAKLSLASHPNPFNPSTNLSFQLVSAGRMQLEIFNVAGSRVRTLHEGFLPAGPASFHWDGIDEQGREVPSGIYFGRVAGSGKEAHCKLVLIR